MPAKRVAKPLVNPNEHLKIGVVSRKLEPLGGEVEADLGRGIGRFKLAEISGKKLRLTKEGQNYYLRALASRVYPGIIDALLPTLDKTARAKLLETATRSILMEDEGHRAYRAVACSYTSKFATADDVMPPSIEYPTVFSRTGLDGRHHTSGVLVHELIHQLATRGLLPGRINESLATTAIESYVKNMGALRLSGGFKTYTDFREKREDVAATARRSTRSRDNYSGDVKLIGRKAALLEKATKIPGIGLFFAIDVCSGKDPKKAEQDLRNNPPNSLKKWQEAHGEYWMPRLAEGKSPKPVQAMVGREATPLGKDRITDMIKSATWDVNNSVFSPERVKHFQALGQQPEDVNSMQRDARERIRTIKGVLRSVDLRKNPKIAVALYDLENATAEARNSQKIRFLDAKYREDIGKAKKISALVEKLGRIAATVDGYKDHPKFEYSLAHRNFLIDFHEGNKELIKLIKGTRQKRFRGLYDALEIPYELRNLESYCRKVGSTLDRFGFNFESP